MKKVFNVIFLTITLGFTSFTTQAQTSHKSGFYPGVDSLFFEVNWNVGVNQQIYTSVNKFSDDDYQPYIGGVWLKDRSNLPNTWEDKIYARNPCNYPFDDTLKGENRNKVNVIRVILFDTITQSVIKDSVYVIGINQIAPKFHSFFITVDSFEFAEMMDNYDEDIRPRAWLTLFSPNGKLEASQPVEFYISAGSSACIANKGFTVKATDEAPILGPKNLKTSVFTGSSVTQNVKKIKLRSGNGGQFSSYGIHEIVEKILDYPALMVGGVRNNVGIIYINGSYWSLTFPQEKSDDERVIASKWGVDKDSVDVIVTIPFNIYVDSIYSGTKLYYVQIDSVTWLDTIIPGTYVRINFTYDSLSNAFYQQLGFDTLQFFPNDALLPENVVTVVNPDGQKNVVATADAGTAQKFQPIAQRLNEMVFDTSANHYDELITLIDIDMWLRYIVVINYFYMFDVISNNVAIIMSHQNMATLVGTDFDGAGVWGLNGDNWNTKIFFDTNTSQYDGGFLFKVIRLILRSPQAKERIVLLYQDMLNTVLLPSRTTEILDTMRSKIMLEYPYHHQAWGGSPNGGQDSSGVENTFATFRDFVSNRSDFALQYLTNQFQPLDSLSVSNNLHTISIVLDSIPVNSVSVVLNRDTLTQFASSWSGKYLKNPDINIDVRNVTVPVGYELYIKEYPDSGQCFNFSPDSAITITFVLRQDVVTGISHNGFTNNEKLSIYPNPSFGIVNFTSSEEIQEVVVYDLKGQVVTASSHPRNFIDMRFFEKGSYLCVFITKKGESITKKVILQ